MSARHCQRPRCQETTELYLCQLCNMAYCDHHRVHEPCFPPGTVGPDLRLCCQPSCTRFGCAAWCDRCGGVYCEEHSARNHWCD